MSIAVQHSDRCAGDQRPLAAFGLLTWPHQEAAMFGRLHHIAYRCRDAQRTVDFYTDVLGFTKKRDIPLGEHR